MSCMLAMSGFQWLMALALFAVCLLLMLIILVQKGRGGGLASAFGGGGGGGSAFGAKTGDVFTGITVVLAVVFLLLTVFGNYVFRPPTAQAVGANVTSPGAGGAPTADEGEASPETKKEEAVQLPAKPAEAPATGTEGKAPAAAGEPKPTAQQAPAETTEGEAVEQPPADETGGEADTAGDEEPQ